MKEEEKKMSSPLQIDVERVEVMCSKLYRNFEGITPWDLLMELKAVYQRPVDGSFIGYTGEYGEGRNWVGEVYLNMAMVDRYPNALRVFADRLMRELVRKNLLDAVDIFVGAPMGGVAFAQALAHEYKKQCIYPEKVKVSDGPVIGRAKTELRWKRHRLIPGQGVIIVEDVCHNMSTMKKMIELVEYAGCSVLGIVCIVNRSEIYEDKYFCENCLEIPLLSIERRVFPKYRQDDPVVGDSRVIFDPKDKWERLIKSMGNND